MYAASELKSGGLKTAPTRSREQREREEQRGKPKDQIPSLALSLRAEEGTPSDAGAPCRYFRRWVGRGLCRFHMLGKLCGLGLDWQADRMVPREGNPCHRETWIAPGLFLVPPAQQSQRGIYGTASPGQRIVPRPLVQWSWPGPRLGETSVRTLFRAACCSRRAAPAGLWPILSKPLLVVHGVASLSRMARFTTTTLLLTTYCITPARAFAAQSPLARPLAGRVFTTSVAILSYYGTRPLPDCRRRLCLSSCLDFRGSSLLHGSSVRPPASVNALAMSSPSETD